MNFSILCFSVFILRYRVNGQVPDTTPLPLALTSFTCHGRPPGYYADLGTGCKTYHVCDGNSQFTYICPRRTLFQQRSRICDHSYLVRCEDSPHFYEVEDDEEEVLIRLPESEENLPSKEEFVDDRDPEREFISTKTPEFTTETALYTTDEPTEIATAPKLTIATETTTSSARIQKVGTESTVARSVENFSSQPAEKFLKIRLNDFRSLFFIPEFDDNSIVAKPEREFLLPVDKSDFMKFKNQKEVSRTFSLCPAYCNPTFFLPGTCHPCIMIK